MNLLRTIPQLLITAGLYLCAATAIAQGVGLAMAWSQGSLSRDKLVRYAAVLYGIAPSQLPAAASDENTESDETTRGNSAAPTPNTTSQSDSLLSARGAALQKSHGDVHELVRDLQTDRQRFEVVKKSFEDMLSNLETEISATAISEVRATLEVLRPQQAKDLILRMLEETSLDPQDDVMDDVIQIVTSMQQSKLKKILSEFKTESERQKLHKVFVSIGQLVNDQPGELAP
jgi:hypothetical protein